MSNLPHPLGDSNPGDLFYPGSPSVIVSDLPGAAGSRAVEFGEDGLSSVVNRMGYALGKNDEYMQLRLEQTFARPDLVTFTPAGGNGGNYTFSASVWCGDTAYQPEDQSMRNALISVLDQRYNDLVDPVSGDVIVVKEILDAPAGSSQVGVGFSTNPYLTFRKMNPVTGALGADYTIPDGTKVWLAFGRAAALDSLVGASAGELQDAWFRGFPRSIGEIHAATFLKDGSRKATGSFDMDGNDLTNVGSVQGVSGAPLVLEGLGGATANVNLLSSDVVQFKDQYMAAYLPLNSGDAAIEGDHTSLLTSLNSQVAVSRAFHGNRHLDRLNPVTFTDGTGAVAWPQMTVMINGERRVIASGSLTATSDANLHVAVVTSAGSVVERNLNSIYSTDIPIASYTWSGGVFTRKSDIRWAFNDRTKHLEITCGSGGATDFGSTDLNQAIALACIWSSAAGTADNLPVVRVLGSATAPLDAPYNITLTAPIILCGQGPGLSVIASDETNGHTVDFIDCAGHKIVVRDLTIDHRGDTQANTLSAFKNAGSGSVFQNLKMFANSGYYDVGFANCFLWTQVAENILIDRVVQTHATHSFVMGSTTGLTAYLTNSRIRDCTLAWHGNSPTYGILANGAGNIIENVNIEAGVTDYALVCGGTLIDHCTVDMTGAVGTPACVLYQPPGAAVDGHLVVRDCVFANTAGSGVAVGAVNSGSLIAKISVRGCLFNSVNKPLAFNDWVAVHAASEVLVEGCTTYNSVEYAVALDITQARVSNCVFDTVGGDGIIVGPDASAHIANNSISGYGSSGAYSSAMVILYNATGIGCEVHNNVIAASGAPASSVMVTIARERCNFSNNRLIGGGATSNGLVLGATSKFCLITGNEFKAHTGDAVVLSSGADRNSILDNIFTGVPTGMFGIRLTAAADTLIKGNLFHSSNGSGIVVTDGGSSTDGANNQIVGNHFRSMYALKAVAPLVNAVIYINPTGGGCLNCIISDNHIFSFGFGQTEDLFATYGIYCGAAGAVIANNHVGGMYGSSGASTTIAGIYLNSVDGVVKGNVVDHSFDVEQNPTNLYGIYIYSNDLPVVCCGNMVRFHGSGASGAGKKSYAFNLSTGGYVAVTGNAVTDWVHTGADNKAFNATAGSSNRFVGNMDGSVHGSLVSTSAPSNTAYNINTGNPRADFNTGTGF